MITIELTSLIYTAGKITLYFFYLVGHAQIMSGWYVRIPYVGVSVFEWESTSTLSELFSAINKLSGLFNITVCKRLAVSDISIDYMTYVSYKAGGPRTEHFQLASNKLGLCLGWKGQ